MNGSAWLQLFAGSVMGALLGGAWMAFERQNFWLAATLFIVLALLTIAVVAAV